MTPEENIADQNLETPKNKEDTEQTGEDCKEVNPTHKETKTIETINFDATIKEMNKAFARKKAEEIHERTETLDCVSELEQSEVAETETDVTLNGNSGCLSHTCSEKDLSLSAKDSINTTEVIEKKNETSSANSESVISTDSGLILMN